MTIVTINYADQDVEVIAGADAWTTSISTNRRFNGQRYNATRANQDEIRWNRYFPKSGTYRVKVVHLTDAASGITKLGINGVNGTKNTTNILNDDDWYSGSQIQNVESFATVEIARGFNYINHLTNSKNGSSSNYYIYYEFVEFTLINEHPVLGEATASPRNGMELLTTKQGTGAGSPLTTDTFTAKKYLWIQMYIDSSSSCEFRVGTGGTISTSGYALNTASNGGTNETKINQVHLNTPTSKGFINMFIVNNSANEKLFIYHLIDESTAGAGTSPNRREYVGKWVNTSGQIDVVQLYGSGVTFNANSVIKVWGMD